MSDDKQMTHELLRQIQHLEHVIAQLEAENSTLREELARQEYFNRSK